MGNCVTIAFTFIPFEKDVNKFKTSLQKLVAIHISTTKDAAASN
jgi:hypothetical protein